MDTDASQALSPDTLSFARSYQLDALEKALMQNTIVFLETGSGKTLIAVMLLRSYAHLLRKPSPFFAVFLVPQVVLVSQQAEVVKMHTDLKVGMYWGEMGVDFWDAATWEQEIVQHEVLVMTPQILLDGLRHSFIKLDRIRVLIMDECHHTRGKHPYACIMTEFYHRQLSFSNSDLPRIFGMTASPIKSKVASSDLKYWEKIDQLETIMHSKVYTCASESVLAEYVPFSTPKFKFYKHMDIPYAIYANLVENLKNLEAKHECSVRQLDLTDTAADSIRDKVSKVCSTLIFCLDELGVWLAFKAAQLLSCYESDFLSWGKLDLFADKIVKNFSLEASLAFTNCMQTGPEWSIGDDANADLAAGLLTTKTLSLIESLLEYRSLKDIRCIVFVERVVTAIIIPSLLNEFFARHIGWKTKYIAGNSSGLQSQTRKIQNEIVEEFRRGMVNIIVATSILEEGLDVQSCNLVIRFDPSATVSSFIQSRGRARKQSSDYLLMVKSGDTSTISRLKNYLSSGDIMRKESLRHASLPCLRLQSELCDDEYYCVESTEAIVTLSSSVNLVYFYCSRLPSDGYFKPGPRFVVEKEKGICNLQLPNSCPIQSVCVHGNFKTLKQKACLEACKQLHSVGALTDNLVPDIVAEEFVSQDENDCYDEEQPIFFPPELVNHTPIGISKYHCYLIELKQHFSYDIPTHDVVLVMRNKLDTDILSMDFNLEVDRGLLAVNLKYIGEIDLAPELVNLCRRFQITLFRVLMDHSLNKLNAAINGSPQVNDLQIEYFLLPSVGSCQIPSIDWASITSLLFSYENVWKDHVKCPLKDNARVVQTKSGPVCVCMLQNSLVYTPHNEKLYCITGVLEDLSGKSVMKLRDGTEITYKEYYQKQHGIKLCFDRELFINGRHIFPVQNYLHRCRQQNTKVIAESKNGYVQLPPELCCIIMSPISISTLYSYTFFPSIMQRLEALLIAINLRKLHLDYCMINVVIPANKVLEAITAKSCQEKFHLESLETLGDSFLKYAASQQLFKTFQTHHEGLLSVNKDRIISNAALRKLGCDCQLTGFIRNESFDPKDWIIPGDNSGGYSLIEHLLTNGKKIYVRRRRNVKGKTVADVVEALIGAYLSTGGETAALTFMDWIGIKVDFVNTPYVRHFEVQAQMYVNVPQLEALLNYSFRDQSLLVEALTHGSYMIPEIPRCYQRLEFLGDAVLDYLVTLHLYNSYPGMTPGLLTDMRSASVNNDCYAQSAIKRGLHKHILHASHVLYKDICKTVRSFEEYSMESTFGWESEASFPKVLGDVIESLAGAILVDSGYNKEVVFHSLRPLLEPLITPATLRFHPVRELTELCQKHHFSFGKPKVARVNNIASVTVEVEANGAIFKHATSSADKNMAKRLACKEVLKSLKEFIEAKAPIPEITAMKFL